MNLLEELKKRRDGLRCMVQEKLDEAAALEREAAHWGQDIPELDRAIAALEPATPAASDAEGWIKLEPDQSIQISRPTASHSLFGGVAETRHVQFLTEFGQIVGAGMIGTSTVDGSKHLGGKNTHYRIVTDFPPATEPAHEQDAAPLPQPQTDAGSGIESMEYVSRFPNNVTATPFIAPGDALPDSTGPESDGNVFLRLHPVEQATDAGMVGLPEVDQDQPYFACEATAEPANGTDLHAEHDGTGYFEQKIGEA